MSQGKISSVVETGQPFVSIIQLFKNYLQYKNANIANFLLAVAFKINSSNKIYTHEM